MKTYIKPLVESYPLDMSLPIMMSTHDEQPDPEEGQFSNFQLFDDDEGIGNDEHSLGGRHDWDVL